jgi:MFS family permease
MTMSAPAIPPQGAEHPTYRYGVAGFLALVYAFNFMDRQIMAILQEPIRAEFGLTDTQLGMLTGLAFALFYTTCGFPVAWLADRYRRVPIMAAACAIWSLFTVACGFAQTFVQLVIARVLVGAGEAGGSPPAFSLISDYFPPRARGLGMAIYSLGVPIGSALGAALGAWVAARHGWRMAFVAVGAPGVVLALLMLLVVREPTRGRLDGTGAVPAGGTPILVAMRAFVADRASLLTALAAGMSAFVCYAMLAWNPSLLTRVKGMPLEAIAQWYSLVLGLTGLVGTFAAGWLADRLGHRDARWYAWLPASAFALMIPGVVGAILAPDWAATLCWLAPPALLGTMYVAPAIAVVQNNAPPERRTMAGAILVFVTTLMGLGGGPLYLGTISDLAKPAFGERSLVVGYAALLPALVLTVALHLLAARAMRPARSQIAVAA